MKNSLKLLLLLPFALLATGCAESIDVPMETPNTPSHTAPQPAQDPQDPQNPPADPGDNDSPSDHNFPEISVYQKPHLEKASDHNWVEQAPTCLDCIDE